MSYEAAASIYFHLGCKPIIMNDLCCCCRSLLHIVSQQCAARACFNGPLMLYTRKAKQVHIDRCCVVLGNHGFVLIAFEHTVTSNLQNLCLRKRKKMQCSAISLLIVN